MLQQPTHCQRWRPRNKTGTCVLLRRTKDMWCSGKNRTHLRERQGLNLLKLCFQGHLLRHHFPFDLCSTELQPVCLQWGVSIRRMVGWDKDETVVRKKTNTLLQNALEAHLWHDSRQRLRWLPTVLEAMLFPPPPPLCLHVHLWNIAFVQPLSGWHLEGGSSQFSS